SVMVQLNESFDASAVPELAAAPSAEGAPAPGSRETAAPARPVATEPLVTVIGDNAEGVRVAGQILGAARNARWPMYLRNVKQILRQAEGGFDERRYGFSGLVDLLKACQRDGLLRIERDRRGGLRVFQGASLRRAAPPAAGPGEVIDVTPIATEPAESIEMNEP